MNNKRREHLTSPSFPVCYNQPFYLHWTNTCIRNCTCTQQSCLRQILRYFSHFYICLGNIFNYSVHCVLTCLHKLCEQTICQHLHTSNKWYLFKNRLFWKLKPLVSSTIPDWSLSYSNIVIVTRRGWADKKRDYLGIFVKFPNNPFCIRSLLDGRVDCKIKWEHLAGILMTPHPTTFSNRVPF